MQKSIYEINKGFFTIMTLLSKSEEETKKIAKDFAKSLKAPQVVAFFGELGAGKTVFIKAMAEQLGVTDTVVSPTFAISCEYECKYGKFVHYDMYRISGDELYDVGFYDSLTPDAIVAIEWSENIISLIEENWHRIDIQKDDDKEDVRTIKITKGGGGV